MLLPETHADRIQLIASILARDPSHEVHEVEHKGYT